MQVNRPDVGVPQFRTLEWKHMMEPGLRESVEGKVITTETPYTPQDPGDYEYPFPDAANQRLYERYRERAEGTAGLLVCGHGPSDRPRPDPGPPHPRRRARCER